jgi:serine/threonine protein kinase
MLSNHGCQTDANVRYRYSVKVFSVLLSIAQALRQLHHQGFVHGGLSLETCGKFDDKWKLLNLLGVQKVGEVLDSRRVGLSSPPEAVLVSSQNVAERSIFRDGLVAHPSLDLWAYGKVAYEALVGLPLIKMDNCDDHDNESVKVLLHWNKANLLDVRRQLELVGVSNAGISLVTQCLTPVADTRITIDELLRHSVWMEFRRQTQVY